MMNNEELDRWLAEKVMGWTKGEVSIFWRDSENDLMVDVDEWNPTEDRNHTWMVLTHIYENIDRVKMLLIADKLDDAEECSMLSTPLQICEAIYEVMKDEG